MSICTAFAGLQEKGDMPSMIRCMVLALVLLLTSALSFAQTQTEHFDIDRFRIVGNTLLKPDEIEAVLKPFIGKHREYGDVQHAIEALRQRYRSGGYSVVWVVAPEQNLDRGVAVSYTHLRAHETGRN